MELIGRYIYAVTRRLPRQKKEDIEQELRGIIDEMLEHRQGSSADVVDVLQELGDPDVLAKNFRGQEFHLIGPGFFNQYMMVLKIVMGAFFLGISIATALAAFLNPSAALAENLIAYLGSLFNGELYAFAWVTIVFALVERYAKEPCPAPCNTKAWSITDLPQIPQKKSVIPRSQPIVAIIFSTIFIIIFWSTLRYIGAFFLTEGMGWKVIPVFDFEIITSYKLLIVAIFLLGIGKEILKLIAGRWTLRLSLMVMVITFVSLLLTIFVLSNPEIWNPNFAADFSDHVGKDITNIWEMITSKLVFAVALGYLIEIATMLYKGLNHSRS